VSQGKGFEQRYRILREIIETITLTLLMFLIIRFAVQNFRVDGMSMEPSLHNQEYILVNKAAFVFHTPQRGDVIVFEYPFDPQVDYVKRIIAIPGDVISVVGEKVTVDDVTLREPYVNPADPFNPFSPIYNRVVPSNDYFVMGDNRGNSSDSRQWGFVPRQNIIGQATFVYWPFGVGNFGLLPDYTNVFAGVRQ
jgi:signal peptidase I